MKTILVILAIVAMAVTGCQSTSGTGNGPSVQRSPTKPPWPPPPPDTINSPAPSPIFNPPPPDNPPPPP